MYIANYLYNKCLAPQPTRDQYVREYQAILEKIKTLGNEDEAGEQNHHVEESYMPDAEFFRYKGKVTHLYSDGNGRIDGKYMLTSGSMANKKLKIGDWVICTARKISDDQPIVIYKIDSVEEEYWDATLADIDGTNKNSAIPLNTCLRVLRGEIKQKFNGEIVIDTRPETPQPIKILISESECTFNPMAGDQVEVEALFGINRENPSECTVFGYYGMKANERKTVTGEITAFKKKLKYGLIDNKYIFYVDILQHSDNQKQNAVPNEGDTVVAEVISSLQKPDYGEFFFRCIKITKISSNKSKNATSSSLENNDTEIVESDDEIDCEDAGIVFTRSESLSVVLDGSKEKKYIELTATNVSDRTRKISPAKFQNQILASQLECDELYRPHDIRPGDRYVYKINLIGILTGVFKVKIDFKIDNKYSVRRCFTLDVKNVEEVEYVRVKQTKAYTQKIYTNKREISKGQAPISSPHFIDNRLERFEVPEKLFLETMAVNTSADLYDMVERMYGDVFSSLSKKNYASYFHTLLYFEEVFMRIEFRTYDQDRGHFVRDREYLAYEMKKNVFECRPSIVIGDMVYAESLLKTTNNQQYQGYIHKMTKNRLLLKFNDEFHNNYLGEDYKLTFKFSRTKFMKWHNAIERVSKKLLNTNSGFLFPSSIKTGDRPQMQVKLIDGEMILDYPKQKMVWFNPKLNEIQKQAVVNVLRGEVKMCPYLVFGPPGTGKTSTLAEIILQLYKKGSTRLIVAAPSNSAANLITKLLADCGALKAGEFARIVSQNAIEREQIPDELRPHCMTVDIAAPRSTAEPQNPFENGIRVQCNSQVISLHRILISTCNTFGSLLYMKFKSGHFTHAIIDEAGQCTEPEIAIPISLIDRDNGQIILAGDPHQLGPIVLSPIGRRCGLDKSLLSRLLDLLPYHKDVGRNGGFDERMVTQLLHNYRSLPSILARYSNLSYDSKLIANVSDKDSNEQRLLAKFQSRNNSSLKLKHSPKFGVYFLGIKGEDQRPNDSTSWRNLSEVNQVAQVIKELYDCGLTEDDIGVITPYALQVKNIRQLCDSYFEGKLPKIGSVEEFQGQERNAIVISTVRANIKNVSHDGKSGLGFIKNKNRLNVAISRARAILVIIGNPFVLVEDENWKQIIHDCHINGTYSGCEISPQLLEP
ncbi:probable RNA helicase armi [Contarinia nasturtii]|uniref:probable RNA helicase armi n=1 Tax=Contarinia nasturtii TaxID=265458 RepID=UPI0012D4404B|nr:probable RNA helicase armi [Contarinia nasturtii]